ncbi:conserved hypothetical protein [Beijerinckia indica subsp. indica ATCC 9039]|uniref:DUF2147 domain-containing protein n=1 Tax=Beijerinckia indica subsp. indica (strain ATCC 9039 / DSM 1715 / NCIMB 8712) TaxID=395963 RepID=B2IIX6_BEII9|nr:conserved hypothetical protein [Beijerinckia indica subsp. indica ATCC 9039]
MCDPIRSRQSVPIAILSFWCFLGPIAPLASAAPASDPSGLWFTKDNKSIIKIAPCDAHYCGTLVWLKEPNESDGTPKVDQENTDPKKRNRPIIGIDLLHDLEPEKNYWRGKAYNPADGKIYDVTFKVIGDTFPGEKAEVEGCLLHILCKSQIFTRAQAIPKPPELAQ